MQEMLLLVGFHAIAATSLVVMSALTLHFFLLIPILTGAAIGLSSYVLLLLFWQFVDPDSDL